jgi:malonate-semialdehyde dehydrogenase (acetylating) / methylmalonate-semialdehyde dehydrogenase
MVPMWTIPIAIMMGNTIILKPSEKVPITMHRVVQLMKQAGIPDGVVTIVNGTKSCVEALIRHPKIQAVTFVGSSTVAKIISDLCHEQNNKRCTALGGAKNHLVALTSDCPIESTANDITISFAGCAGQRCMAASVLLLVSTNHPNDTMEKQNGLIYSDDPKNKKNQLLLDTIVKCASQIQPGNEPGQMGPVIDHISYQRILQYIDLALQDGAQLLLDGRIWKDQYNTDIVNQNGGNNWIGPTILLHHNSSDTTMQEEVFGPVLSIYICSSWNEAITIENKNPYGNAASIYTTIGSNAQWFLSKFRAAMLGRCALLFCLECLTMFSFSLVGKWRYFQF